jgi:hypothetical protein
MLVLSMVGFLRIHTKKGCCSVMDLFTVPISVCIFTQTTALAPNEASKGMYPATPCVSGVSAMYRVVSGRDNEVDTPDTPITLYRIVSGRYKPKISGSSQAYLVVPFLRFIDFLSMSAKLFAHLGVLTRKNEAEAKIGYKNCVERVVLCL